MESAPTSGERILRDWERLPRIQIQKNKKPLRPSAKLDDFPFAEDRVVLRYLL